MYYAGACVSVCVHGFFFVHINRCCSMYVCQLQTTMSVCFSIGLQCMEGKLSTCVSMCVCVY